MTGHDIHTSCCTARSLATTDNGIEYGIPGLVICGSVAKSSREDWPYERGVWRYETYCHVAKRHVRGVKLSRNEVLSEVAVWLRTFGCPGDVPREDGTPDGEQRLAPQTFDSGAVAGTR